MDGVADRDAATYATIGEHLSWQVFPYTGFFDIKQPLAYPPYAVLDALWPANMNALRITSGVLAGLTAWIVFAALRPLAGTWRAALGAAIALIAGASTYVEGGDLNIEQLVLPLATAAVLVPLAFAPRARWWWLPVAAGVLAGLAALTKASLALGVVAGLLPLLAHRAVRGQSTARTVALYAAGVLAPVACVVLFYAARGAFGDLFEATVTANRRYTQITPGAERWDRFWSHGELWLLMGAGILAGVTRLLARRDLAALTILLWLAGLLVAAFIPGPAFPHYFVPMVPAAACLLALGPSLPARLGRRAVVAFTIVLAAVAVFPFAREDVRAYEGPNGSVLYRVYGHDHVDLWANATKAGLFLRERARPGDRLHVGESTPQAYWYSRIRPATRVVIEDVARMKPELLGEVQRGLCRYPPKFVVLPFTNWPAHLTCLPDEVGYREIMRAGTVVVVQRVGT
jgi:hypothetical protein